MGIVWELNEAARKDHNRDRAALAKKMALDITGAITELNENQSREAMTRLNGLWARGEKLLKIMGEPAPPNPRSDEMRVDEKIAA